MAAIFIEAMQTCDYLIPQQVPDGYHNSYYTLGVVYEGQEAIGVTWEAFRKTYVEAGGDGIYGAWSVPYLEPMVANRQYVPRCPCVYENIYYNPGLCPRAEQLQPKLMQFKTNYRSLELAEMKANILRKVIKSFS